VQDLTAREEELKRLAHKRAIAKLGWYTHALVYITVNASLALLSGLHGRHWAIYPAMGWGLGLLIHGVAVFLILPGTGLHAHLRERERRRLSQQDRPR